MTPVRWLMVAGLVGVVAWLYLRSKQATIDATQAPVNVAGAVVPFVPQPKDAWRPAAYSTSTLTQRQTAGLIGTFKL